MFTGFSNLDKLPNSSCKNGANDQYVRENGSSRAASPWNSSVSFSEQSSDGDSDVNTELTVTNLPNFEPGMLQEMLTHLFTQYVTVLKISIWGVGEGLTATVYLKSEWDARLLIARIHKRKLENNWAGRRLELSIGRPSPVISLDVLKNRLRAILVDQPNYMLPLLCLRDAYAVRYCCALTTSDILKVKDTVVIHENAGRMVQLIDPSPMMHLPREEEPAWKCSIHSTMNTGQEDGSRILAPVYIELSVLAENTKILLKTHGGIVPLLR